MSLCKSIDTLSMAYLDDELAAEERHELEAHLTECSQCRGHVDQERADRSVVRKALAVGPAPDLLRARISKALDAEDRAEQKATRRRWSTYLLPGSAMLAAAAAIAVFVGVQNESMAPRAKSQPLAASTRPLAGKVSNSVSNVTRRSLPLEVQGASTGPWLRQNFAPQVEPPKFSGPDDNIIGARLLPGGIDGHDAALVAYNVTLHGKPFVLTVLFVRDIGPTEWDEGGEPVKVNNRSMHVMQADDGNKMVSYVDRRGIGYIFNAPEISTEDLVSLVGRTELVGDQ
jgi:mycothiol system anti-sigma-R factor